MGTGGPQQLPKGQWPTSIGFFLAAITIFFGAKTGGDVEQPLTKIFQISLVILAENKQNFGT